MIIFGLLSQWPGDNIVQANQLLIIYNFLQLAARFPASNKTLQHNLSRLIQMESSGVGGGSGGGHSGIDCFRLPPSCNVTVVRHHRYH